MRETLRGALAVLMALVAGSAQAEWPGYETRQEWDFSYGRVAPVAPLHIVIEERADPMTTLMWGLALANQRALERERMQLMRDLAAPPAPPTIVYVPVPAPGPVSGSPSALVRGGWRSELARVCPSCPVARPLAEETP